MLKIQDFTSPKVATPENTQFEITQKTLSTPPMQAIDQF